jgi:hypothetical protein
MDLCPGLFSLSAALSPGDLSSSRSLDAESKTSSSKSELLWSCLSAARLASFLACRVRIEQLVSKSNNASGAV